MRRLVLAALLATLLLGGVALANPGHEHRPAHGTGYQVVTREVDYAPDNVNGYRVTTETLSCPAGKRATEAGVRDLRPADGTPTEVKGDPVFGAGWKSMADPVSSGNQLGPYGPTDAGAWRLVGTLSFPGWGDPASPERPAGFGWFGAVVTYYVVCIGS